MTFFVGDPSAPTRFGEDVAATGDPTGLFLKLFGGEVFAAFSEQTITQGRHYRRSIASGKSAQFPKTWKVEAEYHVAGQEMLGQTTDETERVITIDGLLVSHIGIYDLDEAMSHFDIRSRYTMELGRALARKFDQNVFRTIAKTATGTDSANGFQTTAPFPGGTVINDAFTLTYGHTTVLDASGAVGDDWWRALRTMRVRADELNIPMDDQLYVAVPPATFDALRWAQVADTATNPFIFIDLRVEGGMDGGARGGVSSVLRLEGIDILKTNLLPGTNETADPAVKAKYRADYSNLLGVGWHTDAVGTVDLIGMGLEQTRDVRRQEDFIVAKMAVGHGAVRNEGAFRFDT